MLQHFYTAPTHRSKQHVSLQHWQHSPLQLRVSTQHHYEHNLSYPTYFKGSNVIIPIQMITSPDVYSIGLLTPKSTYITSNNIMLLDKIKCVNHLFSLTQLYLPSVIEYNTTCFGPRCGPSSGVIYRLSYVRCMGWGGGRDLVCFRWGLPYAC